VIGLIEQEANIIWFMNRLRHSYWSCFHSIFNALLFNNQPYCYKHDHKRNEIHSISYYGSEYWNMPNIQFVLLISPKKLWSYRLAKLSHINSFIQFLNFSLLGKFLLRIRVCYQRWSTRLCMGFIGRVNNDCLPIKYKLKKIFNKDLLRKNIFFDFSYISIRKKCYVV